MIMVAVLLLLGTAVLAQSPSPTPSSASPSVTELVVAHVNKNMCGGDNITAPNVCTGTLSSI